MTEEELLVSKDFASWCKAWERDSWCPVPFADWCLEYVGETAFEAAMWAVEKEERGVSNSGNGGPFYRTRPTSYHAWFCLGDQSDLSNFPSHVPLSPVIPTGAGRQLDSFPAAIVYYLLNFDREIAAKFPPKERS